MLMSLKKEVFRLLEEYKPDYSNIRRCIVGDFVKKSDFSKNDLNKLMYNMNRLVEKYIELALVIKGKFVNVESFCLIKGYSMNINGVAESSFLEYKNNIGNLEFYFSSDFENNRDKISIILTHTFNSIKKIRDEIYVSYMEYFSYIDSCDVKYLSNLHESVKSLYERKLALMKDDKEKEKLSKTYQIILDELIDCINKLCEE